MSFAIVSKAVGLGRKIGTIIYPHLPTIAVVGGSIGVAAGAVFACKATLRVDEVLAEHNATMAHIREGIASLPEGSLTKQDIIHDKAFAYGKTIKSLVRLYAPAIGLGVAGFAAIFGGFGLLKNWHTLALSGLTAIEQKFNKYRGQVIDTYGDEIDKKFAGEILEVADDPVEIKTIDEETGEEVVDHKSVVFENVVEDDYTRIFDCTCEGFQNNYVLDMEFLKRPIDWYRQDFELGRRSHVFMNKLLENYRYSNTGFGAMYGWINKNPGDHVSVTVTPCIRIWDDDNQQFPMLVPLDFTSEPTAEHPYAWQWNDEMDEEDFRNAYHELDGDGKATKVAYIVKFNVDTNDKGIPEEIFTKVYDVAH